MPALGVCICGVVVGLRFAQNSKKWAKQFAQIPEFGKGVAIMSFYLVLLTFLLAFLEM